MLLLFDNQLKIDKLRITLFQINSEKVCTTNILHAHDITAIPTFPLPPFHHITYEEKSQTYVHSVSSHVCPSSIMYICIIHRNI